MANEHTYDESVDAQRFIDERIVTVELDENGEPYLELTMVGKVLNILLKQEWEKGNYPSFDELTAMAQVRGLISWQGN